MKYRAFVSTNVVLLILGLVACGKSNPPLELRVRTLDGALVINNKENVAANDCWVQINRDFEVRDVNLAALGEVRIPLSDFTQEDGSRFNILTHKINEILVQCFKPIGRSTFFG